MARLGTKNKQIQTSDKIIFSLQKECTGGGVCTYQCSGAGEWLSGEYTCPQGCSCNGTPPIPCTPENFAEYYDVGCISS